jgi:HEAT repeat protein
MMRRTITLSLFLLLWVFSRSVSLAVDIDHLVSQLGGEDEVARSSARQSLARSGAEAVPKILPLIAHEDERVWRAASNTLADIAHEVSAPGREEERMAVTADLMTHLSPEQSDDVKRRVMRLLPLIVPEGFDVSPLATLLDDPEVRERARVCLEEIGTKEARAALCGALNSPDAEFVRAILNSLRELGSEDCTEKIGRLLRSEDPLISLSAARAFTTFPNPEVSNDRWRVVERATPETRLEAERMFLAYLESLGLRSEFTMNLYARAVEKFLFAPTRGAALIGLAQCGGVAAIDRLVEAASAEESGDLDAAAIAAFENLEGEGVPEALIAAYPEGSPSLRLKMLPLFGRSGRRELGMFVADRVGSEDSLVRQTALRALSGSGFLEPIVVAAQKASGEDKAEALDILLATARRYERAGDSNLAGEAFLRLHEFADSEATRRTGLEGVARNPTVASLDLVLEAVRSGALGEGTTPALVRLCRKMSESSDLEARRKTLSEIRGRANSTEAIRELLKLSASIGPDEKLAKSLGFVTDWSIVGPFPWDPQSGFTKANIGEPAIDLSASYELQGSELRWRNYSAGDPLATVNLGTAIGMRDKVCAYACAEIEVEEATKAEVRAGSDDGIKIWVNGAVVHENLVDRGSDLDQDRAPIHLKKGRNDILVRVTQGGGGWNFLLRLTRTDGFPLRFEQPSP